MGIEFDYGDEAYPATEAEVSTQRLINYPLYVGLAMLVLILAFLIVVIAYSYANAGYGAAGYVITGSYLWGASFCLLPIYVIIGSVVLSVLIHVVKH